METARGLLDPEQRKLVLRLNGEIHFKLNASGFLCDYSDTVLLFDCFKQKQKITKRA